MWLPGYFYPTVACSYRNCDKRTAAVPMGRPWMCEEHQQLRQQQTARIVDVDEAVARRMITVIR